MNSNLTLVTGATGFVGSAVARALIARGYDVRLLARPKGDRSNIAGLDASIVEGDLRDPASLARAVDGCRYVFHVAADYRIWVPDPISMDRANVAGTQALMLACIQAGVERVVYCSSVAALGLMADGSAADETTPVSEDKIIGTYKKSKYRAEQAVLQLVRDRELPAVIVNPSTPIGPRDIKPTPTGKMIADAAAGRMPAYIDTGLNLVHVDDVAEGHLLALERGRIGERYILGGENVTLPHMLAMVDDVMGRQQRRARLTPGMVYPFAAASEIMTFLFATTPAVTRDHVRMSRKLMYFSSDKAQRELGYSPRPARRALVEAIEWFREHGMIPAA